MNKIIKGAGFHHLALRTNDFSKSIEFYKALGFTIYKQWRNEQTQTDIVLMDIGDGTMLELYSGGSDETAEGRYFHLAISALDIDEAYNIAISAGATSKKIPSIVQNSALKNNIAFVYGLDGEIIEFFKNID